MQHQRSDDSNGSKNSLVFDGSDEFSFREVGIF